MYLYYIYIYIYPTRPDIMHPNVIVYGSQVANAPGPWGKPMRPKRCKRKNRISPVVVGIGWLVGKGKKQKETFAKSSEC